MNVEVDLYNRVISGSATHDLEVVAETNVLQLDAWDITVTSVKEATTGSAMFMRSHGPDAYSSAEHLKNGEDLQFTVGTYNAIIGQTLIIDLGRTAAVGDQISVTIEYSTSPTGHAFSWLNADQTAGGKLPYVFTQCEDINCRSLLPLQDSPANRITYSS
jgi:leukotriene-A4 hydrolase